MPIGPLVFIEPHDGWISVTARYTAEFDTLMGKIPGRIWCARECRWQFPAQTLPEFRRVFSHWQVRAIGGELQDRKQELAAVASREKEGWSIVELPSPIAATMPEPLPSPTPLILSRAEALRVCGMPRNLKHRCLLTLAYSAGLRVGELARLKTSDIDWAGGRIVIGIPKRSEKRYVLLAQGARALLHQYIELHRPGQWLFEGPSGSPLSIRSIQEAFTRARDAAGLSKGLSISSLRHSFAVHLFEAGIDLRHIQKLLGHRSSRTTRLYAHLGRCDVLCIQSPFDRAGEERYRREE